MKKFGIFLLVLILIAASMYFTKPDEDGFSNYLERLSSRHITQYASGTQGLNSNNIDDLKKAKFNFEDFYIYRIFEITSPSSIKGYKYLGLFGVFFKMQ